MHFAWIDLWIMDLLYFGLQLFNINRIKCICVSSYVVLWFCLFGVVRFICYLVWLCGWWFRVWFGCWLVVGFVSLVLLNCYMICIVVLNMLWCWILFDGWVWTTCLLWVYVIVRILLAVFGFDCLCCWWCLRLICWLRVLFNS